MWVPGTTHRLSGSAAHLYPESFRQPILLVCIVQSNLRLQLRYLAFKSRLRIYEADLDTEK